MFETFLFLFFLPSEYILEKIWVQLNWKNRGTFKHHFQIDLKNFDDSVISDPLKSLDYHLFKLNESLFSVFSGMPSVLWWNTWNTEWLKMYILRLARLRISLNKSGLLRQVSNCIHQQGCLSIKLKWMIPSKSHPRICSEWTVPPKILNRQKKPVACPVTNPHVNIQNTYDD